MGQGGVWRSPSHAVGGKWQKQSPQLCHFKELVGVLWPQSPPSQFRSLLQRTDQAPDRLGELQCWRAERLLADLWFRLGPMNSKASSGTAREKRPPERRVGAVWGLASMARGWDSGVQGQGSRPERPEPHGAGWEGLLEPWAGKGCQATDLASSWEARDCQNWAALLSLPVSPGPRLGCVRVFAQWLGLLLLALGGRGDSLFPECTWACSR